MDFAPVDESLLCRMLGVQTLEGDKELAEAYRNIQRFRGLGSAQGPMDSGLLALMLHSMGRKAASTVRERPFDWRVVPTGARVKVDLNGVIARGSYVGLGANFALHVKIDGDNTVREIPAAKVTIDGDTGVLQVDPAVAADQFPERIPSLQPVRKPLQVVHEGQRRQSAQVESAAAVKPAPVKKGGRKSGGKGKRATKGSLNRKAGGGVNVSTETPATQPEGAGSATATA